MKSNLPKPDSLQLAMFLQLYISKKEKTKIIFVIFFILFFSFKWINNYYFIFHLCTNKLTDIIKWLDSIRNINLKIRNIHNKILQRVSHKTSPFLYMIMRTVLYFITSSRGISHLETFIIVISFFYNSTASEKKFSIKF